RRRFDLVLDLQGLFRSGLMAAATGAPRRVGLSSAREGAAWFYTDTVGVPGRLGRQAAVDRDGRRRAGLQPGRRPPGAPRPRPRGRRGVGGGGAGWPAAAVGGGRARVALAD